MALSEMFDRKKAEIPTAEKSDEHRLVDAISATRRAIAEAFGELPWYVHTGVALIFGMLVMMSCSVEIERVNEAMSGVGNQSEHKLFGVNPDLVAALLMIVAKVVFAVVVYMMGSSMPLALSVGMAIASVTLLVMIFAQSYTALNKRDMSVRNAEVSADSRLESLRAEIKAKERSINQLRRQSDAGLNSGSGRAIVASTALLDKTVQMENELARLNTTLRNELSKPRAVSNATALAGESNASFLAFSLAVAHLFINVLAAAGLGYFIRMARMSWVLAQRELAGTPTLVKPQIAVPPTLSDSVAANRPAKRTVPAQSEAEQLVERLAERLTPNSKGEFTFSVKPGMLMAGLTGVLAAGAVQDANANSLSHNVPSVDLYRQVATATTKAKATKPEQKPERSVSPQDRSVPARAPHVAKRNEARGGTVAPARTSGRGTKAGKREEQYQLRLAAVLGGVKPSNRALQAVVPGGSEQMNSDLQRMVGEGWIVRPAGARDYELTPKAKANMRKEGRG